MSRERENVSAQLNQAEQVKLVAEGELAEVRSITFLLANRLLLSFLVLVACSVRGVLHVQ